MNSVICSICGNYEVISVLIDRNDHEYGVSNRLNYFECRNDKCCHVQSSPVPNDAVIASFYINYTTHNVYHPRGLGRFVYLLSDFLSNLQLLFLRYGKYDRKLTRILDYGCGNGIHLRRLASHGYQELVGFDFDPKAIACTTEQGFSCYSDWNKLLSEDKFDVIFLNHVIEHLSSPRSTLNDIFELLRSGGLLVIRTPNARSFLARICGANWRGWETPRHLNIFTHESLSHLFNSISECEVIQASTSNDMSLTMAISSLPDFIKNNKLIKIFCAFALAAISQIFKIFSTHLGEELVFKVRKK